MEDLYEQLRNRKKKKDKQWKEKLLYGKFLRKGQKL